MAILTNGEAFGSTGVSQPTLIDHIIHIEAALHALSVKLDNDGGVTDTDYEADLELIIASGAVPISEKGFTVTTIKAQYDA